MEPCPSCSAPTRTGAKFCTSCGYRLGDDPAPTAEVDPTEAAERSPSDPPDDGDELDLRTQDEPATSLEGSAPENVAPGVDPELLPAESDSLADAEPADAPVDPPADQVLSSAWPASSSTSWPTGWGAIGAPDPPAAEPADPEGSNVDESSSAVEGWPPFPSTPAPDEAGPSPNVAEAESEPTQWDDHSVEGNNDGSAAPEVFTNQADQTDADSGLADDPPPAALLWQPSTDPFSDPEPALPFDVDRESAEADAETPDRSGLADRAVTLLDELRSLLPELVSEPAGDLRAVANDLDATHHEASAVYDDLSALRDAATAARDRPRDIDALVDVAARADVVLALADAYDRLNDAAARAISELRRITDGGA